MTHIDQPDSNQNKKLHDILFSNVDWMEMLYTYPHNDSQAVVVVRYIIDISSRTRLFLTPNEASICSIFSWTFGGEICSS